MNFIKDVVDGEIPRVQFWFFFRLTVSRVTSPGCVVGTVVGFSKRLCSSVWNGCWEERLSAELKSAFLGSSRRNVCFLLGDRQGSGPHLLPAAAAGPLCGRLASDCSFPLLLCRWACSRSTPRSPSPCPRRPKPSSCAASSPTRTAAPPLWTCSPTSS